MYVVIFAESGSIFECHKIASRFIPNLYIHAGLSVQLFIMLVIWLDPNALPDQLHGTVSVCTDAMTRDAVQSAPA